MRYHARWSNGYWKTFDTAAFADTAIHRTKRDAEEAVVGLNASSHK